MVLPTPKELLRAFPLPPELAASIEKQRKEVVSCLRGDDPRIVLIVGPCSLHHPGSALQYAASLSELQSEVSSSFLLVMRAYVEKPRTCLGWKGALYNPYLEAHDNLNQGLAWTRETLLKLSATGIPLATEFLEPLAAPYIEDLISLGFIGSRTTTSQIHRQLASSLPFPVGFKNTPDGSVLSAIHGILAAQAAHTFFHIDENGTLISKQSSGNPHTHLVLRGADHGPNHSAHSVRASIYALRCHALCETLIIDCSHGNSQKDPEKQLSTFHEVMAQIANGGRHIRGVMLESHILGGNQHAIKENHPDRSLTDPCLDWKTTQRELLEAHHALERGVAPGGCTPQYPH